MVSWQAFTDAAPQLARIGRERFDSTELVLMGTLRKDGSPRVTPIEYAFLDGELLLGGMWQSRKMLDLLRDPRCVLHSATSDKAGTQGDFKLYGRALDVTDPAARERAGQASYEATGWRPEEPYHLFRLDVTEAAYVIFGAEAATLAAEAEGQGARVRLLSAGGDPNSTGYAVITWKASATLNA